MRKGYSQTNSEIEQYVLKLFEPEDIVLQEIRERAQKHNLPDIHLAALDALHLKIITKAIGARKVVEIGTLVGYSGVCIARALPADGKLYTFEYKPEHAKVANETFEKAGLNDKVQIFTGRASDNLKLIESEGPFDLVFIDADKGGYPAYFEWAAEHLRLGGVILGDNTFAFGMIADQKAATERNDVKSLREFNRLAAQHKRFSSTILPTGEGLTMCVKIQ
jgi:caffeoyl-CoA O-methyltransferase